jgi:hypothetical protein
VRNLAPWVPGGECHADCAIVPHMPHRHPIADRLVAELGTGRIRSVAFVVPSDVRFTLPLYHLAITTARRGIDGGVAKPPGR